jgi:cobalamin synthase
MIPRSAMVALAWIGLPGVVGPRNILADALSSTSALIAIAEGFLVAILSGWRFAVVSIAVAYVNMDGVRKTAISRLGGVNGTALGAVRQVLEIFLLVLLTLVMRGASR